MGRRDERGVAIVEFALVVPLLIILLLGIVEASWAFSQKNALQSVAREGARLAATREDLDTPGITAIICDGADLEAIADLEATGVGAWTHPGARGFFELKRRLRTRNRLLLRFQASTLNTRVDFVVQTENEPAWWSTSGGGATC